MVGYTATRSERGQIYTLESVIASVLVLTAVLFALQAVVITPTTSGSLDPSIRAEIQQQASDILLVAAQNETLSLSMLARYWQQDTRTFAGPNAVNPNVGYGENGPPGVFGDMLTETFTQRGRIYNVELVYQGRNLSDGQGSVPMVYRGTPADGAVVSSYSVTLYDNQTLTSPFASNAELWEYDTNVSNNKDGYYPVPDASPGPVYNVVEVRVTVW
jgi:hypothetical protein